MPATQRASPFIDTRWHPAAETHSLTGEDYIMSIVSDFVGRVSDAYRGGTAPNSANSAVHGGGYQSPNPSIAKWLDDYPEVSDALAKVSNTVAILDGISEGALNAFGKARERLDEAKAAEARLHHAARELGKAPDADEAKRLMQTRKSALAANEEAASRATIASNGYAHTRNALNAAVTYIGGLAAERRSVVMASAVTVPKGTLSDIIKEQRKLLADLDAKKLDIETAPLPLDDAVIMVRASVLRAAPSIVLGPRRVDWTAPKLPFTVTDPIGHHVELDDSTAMLSWLFPDEMADRLEAAIRARYIGVDKTYTPSERSTALADLASGRANVEALEVAAIKQAWAEGQYVPLRPDVTPAVLLGIAKVGDAGRDPKGYIGSAYLGETAR